MQPEDWIALYDEHMGSLYRAISRRVGGDRTLTEDLVQEAWLAALDHWVTPPDDAMAWLLTCAMNRLRNQLRRRQPSELSKITFDLQSPQEVSEDHEQAQLLQGGLARLRPEQAMLIEAHHLDGRPLAELARAQGTSLRAIEGRLARARRALARALRPFLPAE